MAERIVSPGVFTKEVDQSFLAGGIAQIGAAIVGPTIKGPALVPTQITSFADFTTIFGSYTDDSYVPFVVNDYLRNGNTITVTRLLYEDGYKLTNGALAIIATSASVSYVTHVLHPTETISSTGATNIFQNSALADAGSGSFALKVSGSYEVDTAIPGFKAFLTDPTANTSCSIQSTTPSYITSIFGKSPKSRECPVVEIVT